MDGPTDGHPLLLRCEDASKNNNSYSDNKNKNSYHDLLILFITSCNVTTRVKTMEQLAFTFMVNNGFVVWLYGLE